MKSPRVMLHIDRDKAAASSSNATQIEARSIRWLRPLLGLHHLRRATQNRVLLEMDPKYQSHADSLSESS